MRLWPHSAPQIVHFALILCVAIITAAGWAHLLALPNKIGMSREHYLIAQQIYRGWALLGVVEFGALALAAVLAWLYRDSGAPFLLALVAVACISLGLVIFFWFTFPANQATHNWTMLPPDWQILRTRWEYSHAAGAILEFVALAALVLAALLPCATTPTR